MARYPLRLPITWRQSSYHHLSSRSIRPKNYPTTTKRLFIGLHIVHGVIDPSIYIYIHIIIINYIYHVDFLEESHSQQNLVNKSITIHLRANMSFVKNAIRLTALSKVSFCSLKPPKGFWEPPLFCELLTLTSEARADCWGPCRDHQVVTKKIYFPLQEDQPYHG